MSVGAEGPAGSQHAGRKETGLQQSPGTAVAPVRTRPLDTRRAPAPARYRLISRRHPFKGQLAVDSGLPVGLGAQSWGLGSRRSRPPGPAPPSNRARGRVRLHSVPLSPQASTGRGPVSAGRPGRESKCLQVSVFPERLPRGTEWDSGRGSWLPLARSRARVGKARRRAHPADRHTAPGLPSEPASPRGEDA